MFRIRRIKPHLLALTLALFPIGNTIADGKTIAFDRTKGNCLACHAIAGGESPGNIGPELSNMKQRYPNKQLLRDRIWDETKFNPYTVMPPFGKHQILSEDEIDQVVEFVHTL